MRHRRVAADATASTQRGPDSNTLTMTAIAARRPDAPVRLRSTTSDRIAWGALAAVALVLLAFLAAPLMAILMQAVQDNEERFVGLANFVSYAQTPALLQPLVATVPLQVFACEMAVVRGYDVDQPRNLAKSVTVE